MNAKTSRRLALAAGALLATIAPSAMAQPPGLQIRPPSRDTHRVTLENGMNMSIVVKVAHPDHNVGNYRYDLRPNERVTQNFSGGDRVVIVWDRRGQLQFAAPVIVDRSGLLVVHPPYGPYGAAAARSAPGAPAARGAPDRESPAGAPAGSLQIRPEGEPPRSQPAPPGRGGLQVQPSPQGEPR